MSERRSGNSRLVYDKATRTIVTERKEGAMSEGQELPDLTRTELRRIADEFKSERDAAKRDTMRAFDERNIALNRITDLERRLADARTKEREKIREAIGLVQERDAAERALAEARGLLRESQENIAGGDWIERRNAFLASTPAEYPFRKCEFCGCNTNARLRACCEAGMAADSTPAGTDGAA